MIIIGTFVEISKFFFWDCKEVARNILVFVCLWDSRADEQHYVVKNWPPREDLTPGFRNVFTHLL